MIRHCLVVGLLWPALCVAQTRPDLADEKREAIAAIDNEMAPLPYLGKFDLADVVRFTNLHGKIQPVTTLRLAGLGMQRLRINSMPGTAKASFFPSRLPNPRGESEFFQFYYRDVSDPAAISVYTEVSCNADSVQVSQFIGLPGDGVRSVQLMQSDADGPEAVSLYLQTTQPTGKQSREHLLGATIAELAAMHPAQINQNVRPIFRLLRQEQQVFQGDPKAAYQVLADRCPIDPAAASAAAAAVAGLAADDFANRETAMAKLRDVGEPAALWLMRSRPAGLSAEQSIRVDEFLAAYRPLTGDQIRQLSRSPDFLLDCLFSSDMELKKAALAQLKAVVASPVDLDLALEGAPLDAAITALRARLSPAPQ